MNKPLLSVIIITKNEEQMIGDCLRSVVFAQEIIVVDSGNTDRTNYIAKEYGAKVVKSFGNNYSQFRNDGLKHATGKWILYVDADERVTAKLAQEINYICTLNVPGVYQIPRLNIFLGKQMRYGGWGGDKVIRLFARGLLKKYVGELHEQPVYTGQLQTLNNELMHYSHRDLASMLNKTILFTEYEAKLRLAANHPPIVAWRIVRMMLTEFWYRFVVLSAWRDGTAGVIDGLFQVFNTFIIYARLWELQHGIQQRS